MSASARVKIHLYYDIVSTYSYLAFENLCRYREVWNMDIVFHPVFLGGLWKQVGNQSILTTTSKAAYTFRDLHRLADHYQIPFHFTSGMFTPGQQQDASADRSPSRDVTFPGSFAQTALQAAFPGGVIFRRGSKAPMRFLTAVNMQHPQLTEPLSRELYRKLWARGQDVTEPSSLLEAGVAVGLTEGQAKSCLDRTSSQEVREQLRQSTQEAVDQGAFGVPTIITQDTQGHTQMVFGCDRMEVLAKILGKQYVGPLPPKSNL